ncbi:MAG: ABC transporter permease [Dehalococcoidia bacterium]
MVFQRSLGHWRLFAAMAVGSVLCGALMACVILYSDTVRDLGLVHALESQPRFANDIQVTSTSQRMSVTEYEKLRSTTTGLISSQTSDVASNTVLYGRSATFFATAPGEAVSEDERRPRAHLQFADGLAEHITVVAGKAPATLTTAAPDKPPTIEASIGKAAADALGLRLDQEFDLQPHWRQVAPIRVKITAIIEPRDATEDYWFGKTDRFKVDTPSWPTYPFFIDEATLRSLALYLPDMDASFETYVFVDTGRINSRNAQAVEDRVRSLATSVQAQLTLSSTATGLDATIKDYREKLFFTRLPLFALMIQIVGIVMFYLMMVSTMVVERQAGEIALLKSRGAGTRQIMTVFGIEGLGIALLATILGPFIAAASIKALGLTPSFEDLSHGELLSVPLTPLSFMLAAAGGLMAMAALMWPAYRACRYSITHYKQQLSRPPSQSAFLKYYLDLVLVAAGAFAFYQLRQKGTFVTESLFGDLSADPILLATPTLFMVMVALVFLRLFPLVLRLVLWLTRSLSGATISLGLTRMARSPLQHSRLILLLLLATAVGMFAAGFRSTLERGYEDRAAYLAGAEGRVFDIRGPAGLGSPRFEEAISKSTGVPDVCAALRLSGYFNATRYQSDSVSFLGVHTECFEQLAFWRSDFADSSLSSLLESVQLPPQEGGPKPIEIPAGTRLIGVWALTPLAQNFASMGVRLRDSDGQVWEYRMGTENPQTAEAWQFYVLDLNRPTGTRPQGVQPVAADRKWTLDAFFVQLLGGIPAVSQNVTLLLDDLQVSAQTSLPAGWSKTGFTDGQVIDEFESVDRYELVKGVSQLADPGALSRAAGVKGRDGSVARVQFIRGRAGASLISFRTIRDSRALPAIASQKFLDAKQLKIGAQIPVYLNGQYLTVSITGSYRLFPTFDPESDEPLFVADFDRMKEAASRVPGAGSNVLPNEAWLGSGATTALTREALKEKGLLVEQVYDRAALLEEQSADPLVAASWEGILFLSFAAVLLVSALGFVTYSGLGAQARSLEFAVLRTMGLSARQIFGVVTFEQAFVVLAGVAAGTLLGFPLSRLMIGYMGLTENGKEPLPPLLSIVNWQSVVTVYILLGIVVASTVVALVVLYSRLAVSRALRMGEL